MDLIENQTSRLIARTLDGLAQRHTAIVSNVANAETPGFRGTDVQFESSLRNALSAEQSDRPAKFLPAGALKTTEGAHIQTKSGFDAGSSGPGSIERAIFDFRTNEHPVDIEHEMAQLSLNSGKYATLSKIEAKTFGSLRSMIKGGGG